MKLQYLKERKELVPTVAKWYFEEWGYEDENRTLDIEISDLEKTLNKVKIPLTIIATDEGQLIGTGQLKWKEMSIYPTKEYWLGGVFVKPQNRGAGIAYQIVEQLIDIARVLQIKKLYLQTEKLNGGLYSRMGWKEIEQITYHNIPILVMERDI